jgi:hypothetical protein
MEASRRTGGETGTDRQAGKPGTGAGKDTSRRTGGETGTDRQAGKLGMEQARRQAGGQAGRQELIDRRESQGQKQARTGRDR